MQIPLNKIKYHHLTTIKQIDKIHKYMLDHVSKFAIDTETTGQDKLHRIHVKFTKMYGVSIYFPYHAIWIEKLDEDNKFTKRVIQFLKAILEDKKKIKLLHNATFDYNVLYKHGIKIQQPIWDTQIMANHYDENDLRGGLKDFRIGTKEKGLPLKPLSWKYLDFKYDTLDFEKKDIKEYSLNERITYGGNDVIAPYYLAQFYYPELERQNLLPVFNTIERPTIPALAHMQRTGAVIDVDYLLKNRKEVEKDVEKLEKEVQKLTKTEFNLRSNPQMREVLYDKLKYPVKGKTKPGKTGGRNSSTSSPTLELLKEDLIIKSKDTTIIDKILLYRAIDQIKKMYLVPFTEKHLMSDGRIYPSFSGALTVTSRLNSSNPNFQNLKKEMDDKKDPMYKYSFIVKHSVMAPEGFDMLVADFSQLEIRLLAHCSEEEFLINGFMQGDLDTHISVASEMFEIPYDKITKDKRQAAKEINFGIAYGLSPFGLAVKLKCTEEEAQEKIDRYFNKLPKVYDFIKQTERDVIRKGYVVSITGRKRRLPEVYSDNKWIREAALRQAVNFCIQSPATADINKLAFSALYDKLVDEKKIFLPFDVHDEIVLYTHKSITDEVKPKMQSIMENVYELKVPLVAEVQKKNRWVE